MGVRLDHDVLQDELIQWNELLNCSLNQDRSWEEVRSDFYLFPIQEVSHVQRGPVNLHDGLTSATIGIVNGSQ